MRTSVQLVIGYHFYCCFASFLSIVWDNAPQLQILSSYLCNKKSPYWTIFIAGCGDNAPLCAAPQSPRSSRLLSLSHFPANRFALRKIRRLFPCSAASNPSSLFMKNKNGSVATVLFFMVAGTGFEPAASGL